ncbi:MAG: P-type ATPase, translocating, partial [Microgenomates bacterium 39_7]
MSSTPLYQQPYQTALKKLKTNPETGLSASEVKKRQSKYGPNEIADDKPKHIALTILWHQLNNLLVYVLIAAAVITYFLDHKIDTYVIAAVLVLNTLIGFIQEFKANKAIEALKEIVVSTSKVYRDGELIEIPSHELVPGDVILLEEGDRVPADGRLIEAKNLRVIESSLTGEAFPVEKNIRAITHKVTLGDQKNFVWMSTFVAGGIGKFVVTETGSDTAIGKIAQSLSKIKREKSHFEVKTARLTKQMSIIAISGALVTFLVGFFIRDFTFAEIFTFAVASLVSGIPEGLPAVLVIILATGANRMAKKNAIVRSLPATETLSIVDVIATDKTGTLTTGQWEISHTIPLDQDWTKETILHTASNIRRRAGYGERDPLAALINSVETAPPPPENIILHSSGIRCKSEDGLILLGTPTYISIRG